MLTLKEITEDYKFFCAECLVFKSQTLVLYRLPGGMCLRFSKNDLIAAIRYFLHRLSILGLGDKLKKGFVLHKFKYFELSVYLHGIVQYYCSEIGLDPVDNLFILRFSHLPHDVVKPDKPLLNIEYAVLHDTKGSDYVVCMADKPIYSRTMKGLENQLSPLSLKYRIHLILVNELPF